MPEENWQPLVNARLLIKKLRTIPANEQSLGTMQAVIAQALQDLTDEIEILKRGD